MSGDSRPATADGPREPEAIVASGGATVALHDLGGEGEPLLVCHATGFCGPAYEPFAAALRARYRVLALDLRGHGRSPAPGEPPAGWFAWDEMAADVVACVEHVGGPVRAFGHSLGGAVLLLAELRRPGTLRGAFLYEPIVWPTGFSHPEGGNPMAASAIRRREVFASRQEALARYAARPPLGHLRADCLAAYVHHGFEDLDDGTVRLRCRAESEAATFEAETAMTLDRVAGLGLEVVVGAGGRTPEPGPAGLARPLVAALGRARLQWFPHLGHFGPLECPDEVAAVALHALG